MRGIPFIFRIFLIMLIVGVGFTLLQAQEKPDELRVRIDRMSRTISQLEDQERALERQIGKEQKANVKQELEAQLRDLRARRETLLRERGDLEKKLQSPEEPTGKEPPAQGPPEGPKSVWEPFKQPTVIAAAISAVAVIAAALIGILKRK
jgi:uncharacterized membrane protein YccC